MSKKILLYGFLFSTLNSLSQTNPVITKWLQNTTVTGSYYMSGNSTAISNGILVNCQEVSYSASFAYVKTKGIPAYKVGPFTGDGNPNQAGDQNAIFKFPLIPTQNTGTLSPTTGGNIGVFVNGVAMFDFRDGVAWNTGTGALCGGPGRTPCTPATTAWYRDAIPAERPGFDCSKGHPAGTNYHHHQNPSAFKLDLVVLSTICNLYDADGLYAINTAQHSPLIGFAYDGFPVYGAYGYANVDGTGGITRIKSGYQLRNITERTHYANGTDVSDGPPPSTTYPLGYFREDYEWLSHSGDASYLDEHNGRFCVTPEYPLGTYCYFATVDANHNSAYPYLVGPTYYGNKTASKVASIVEPVTIYPPTVLPITLLNFTGKIEKSNAILNWTTANEINSKQFIIQRSTDGVHFENIGNVVSAGNTSQNSNYSFTDKNIPAGRVYYRLQQVDVDGRSKTYNIISLVNNTSGFEFKVLPNPASDFIAIQYNNGLLEQDTDVKLFDSSGKLITKTQINKGQTITYINIETLYSGTYIVKIQNTTASESHRVVFSK
jgi:YHYH protein/Secretion system C-terminal sorting domain